MAEVKVCKRCEVPKTLADFYPHAGCAQGVRPECMACTQAAKRDQYHADPEKAWVAQILRKYGVTAEWYASTLAEQGGGCGICHTADPGRGDSKFHIDHDHSTGRVRGLLCTNCNRALGYFQDDPARLERAVTYLHQAPALVGERTEASK